MSDVACLISLPTDASPGSLAQDELGDGTLDANRPDLRCTGLAVRVV